MHVTKIEPAVKAEPCKKRVCAYARVSTGKYQQEESLENQIQYYEKRITSNPEYEFAGIFSDRAVPERRRIGRNSRRCLSFAGRVK